MPFPEPRGSRKRLQLFLQSQTKGKIQARRSSKANSPFPAALGCFWQVISLLIRGGFQPPAPPKDGNRAGSRGGAQQSGNVILSSEQLPQAPQHGKFCWTSRKTTKNLPWIFPGCLFGFSAPTQALQRRIFCLFFSALCTPHPVMGVCVTVLLLKEQRWEDQPDNKSSRFAHIMSKHTLILYIFCPPSLQLIIFGGPSS